MSGKWSYFAFYYTLFYYFIPIFCSLTAPSTSSLPMTDSSNNIELQFRHGPIEAAKEPLIFDIHDTIRINCGVKGFPKPTVLFYKGDKLLREPKPEDLNPSRVRIERTTLRIFPAYIEDSGTYRCFAENGFSNISLMFQVNVVEDDNTDNSSPVTELTPLTESAYPGQGLKPYWTKIDRMQKRLHAEPAGNTVRFRCPVDGNPVPRVDWFKDGKIIKKDSRIGGVKYRNNGQMIILETVVPPDQGMYMCKASNKYGSINHTYELDVQERAASRPILKYGLPANKTVKIGSDVEFKCRVYSDPHPHVKWVRYVPIGSGANASEKVVILKQSGINELQAESLFIFNVTEEDSGKYTCIAENYIGTENSSAWLTISGEPPPTEPTALSQEMNLIIYGICGVLGLLVVSGIILFFYYNYYSGKDPPMLFRIENADNLPPMTKIEVPTMMYGNEQAWRRMCLPMQEQFDFNIQPDLQWELRIEDITLTERLDEGFFGQVFKADLATSSTGHNSSMVCAVKMLKASRTEKDVYDLLTEMDQMKRIGKHKNIINLLGVCTQNGPLMLVIEYAAEGNLREFLRRNRPQNMAFNLVLPTDLNNPQPDQYPPQDRLLSQKDLVSFALQVSRGMDYLAQKKCIHRDLAARNVLVTDERMMKIADFGLARDIRTCDYYRKHTRGHLPYKWMALEAMADNVFTHATDVWSFGVLLWEIFSLAGTPYPGIKTGELVKFLRSGERLENPQFATSEMYMLMRDCWEEDPRRRPIFRSLVEDLERMLAEASNDEYINSATADYMDSSESDEESEEGDDDVEDDDVFVQTENSDSVSDGNIPFNDEHDPFNGDPYSTPLLGHTVEENIMHNHHARLQSDV
uniref:fibroblast growth factor receptor-like isoform X2 n=1 Tax=Styela clava TaxID=7725 RepID=UPI00193996AA|nr:fibroblast growth factor receptor-like isoform X2 [Styela clava]